MLTITDKKSDWNIITVFLSFDFFIWRYHET